MSVASNVRTINARFANANMAAHEYLAMGYEPIPIPAKEKEAKVKWKKPLVTKDNVDRLVPATGNVAVVLGKRSAGLVDFDFDHPKADEIAELLIEVGLLPDGPVFGRKTNPSSHRLVLCEDAGNKWDSDLPPALVERLGAAKAKLVEVRGNGHYTVFPGSIHRDTGERIEFENEELTPPPLPWADAVRMGGLISFLVVVSELYPPQGVRNDACLALAGALVSAGIEAKIVDDIVVAIASNAGDDEAQKRRFGERTTALAEADRATVGLGRLCELLDIGEHKADLANWLYASDEQSKMPAIVVYPGGVGHAVDKAEAELLKAGVQIYQRGGELVRPCRIDQSASGNEEHKQRRLNSPPAVGPLVLTSVTETWLIDKLSRIARWLRPSREGGLVACEPPAAVAKRLLARSGSWGFLVLRGVIEAPTLRADLSLLQDEGYDAESQLFFDAGGVTFDRIDESPTEADARASLNFIIQELLRDFPFVPESARDEWKPSPKEGLNASPARSVVLSAILTGLMRRSLRTAPLHGFDAPVRGSGKSLLADTVSIILTGRIATPTSFVGEEAEDEKRLFAELLKSESIINLDNVTKPIDGAALCSVLTSAEWNSRVLRESRNVTVSTTALFLANGNNLVFKGDMTRRAVVARIDHRNEKPENMVFDFNPRQRAASLRSRLVKAGLTALRAYGAAGRPLKKEVKPIGSFEDWNVIRETLIWLGEPDPGDTRDRIQENDPELEELAQVMSAWGDVYSDDPATVGSALEYAYGEPEEGEGGVDFNDLRKRRQLKGAFEQVSFNGKPNARSLGWWFKRSFRRPVDGQVFESAGKDRNRCQLIALRGGDAI